MHHLVGRVLHAHLPAVRRARRRRDEEKLAGVRQRQVRVLLREVQRRWLAKIHAAALAEHRLAVPDGADGHSGGLVEEGDDEAGEGFEGGEGVDRGGLGDQVADGLEVFRVEDVAGLEVGKDERIGWRGGFREWGQVGQVEGEGRLARAGAAGSGGAGRRGGTEFWG